MMKPSRFEGQRSQPARFHRQVWPYGFWEKSSSPEAPVFFPKTLPVEADCKKAPETGNGIPAKHMKIMKTKERIRKIADSRWARTLALAVTAAIIFSWLYSHGISPVWTAVAIICFRGLFRFLYRIACFLVALAIILCILSFLGLLKSDDMEHARNLSLQHKGAVRERAALFVSVTTEMTREEKGKD